MPLAALALWASWSGRSHAIDIVAIEEYWELSVGEPDSASSAPQVSMVMSPSGDLDGDFFEFTLNHRTTPEYKPGGMQVQLWSGENIQDSKSESHQETLSHGDETVTWVQRMSLKNGYLSFRVKSGTSQTWGTFGSSGSLRLSYATDMHNLNNYSPGISIQESGVSFAGNRVRSLVLKKLRWFDSEGHVYELNAPIDVDSDLDP